MTALHWLALTATMTALFWLTYVPNRLIAIGLWATMANPTPQGAAALGPWAQRAKAAHANAIENLAPFAVLVLVAYAKGQDTQASVLIAAQVYFWARLAHFIVFTAGLPGARTVAFTAGWIAQMVVAYAVLRGIGG
ncbi:hypothetical protein BWI17_01895 [Betaproteobacteria bacterium GR16-43]|nr:hypothetical protein BWI17_01895 [Betaproteobacteria bacterium GR16-43]